MRTRPFLFFLYVLLITGTAAANVTIGNNTHFLYTYSTGTINLTINNTETSNFSAINATGTTVIFNQSEYKTYQLFFTSSDVLTYTAGITDESGTTSASGSTTTGSTAFNYTVNSAVSANWTITDNTATSTVSISCPVGWSYLASNYTSITLKGLQDNTTGSTIQGRFNATSQKYENHRAGYNANQNVTVTQKEGYYYYFSSAKTVNMTVGSTPSVTLKTGWNLVGNYGTSARTLSDLQTSIGANATQTQWYNSTSRAWVSNSSQSVPAMSAFMAYVNSETVWSG